MTTKKRGRKQKPSFWHTRQKVGLLNDQQTADVLGVSIEDIKQWSINEGAPVMAERFLLLWDQKRIHEKGWEGFIFSRGILCRKNQRWTPELLIDYQRQLRHITALEREINALKSWRGIWRTVRNLMRPGIQKRCCFHLGAISIAIQLR